MSLLTTYVHIRLFLLLLADETLLVLQRLGVARRLLLFGRFWCIVLHSRRSKPGMVQLHWFAHLRENCASKSTLKWNDSVNVIIYRWIWISIFTQYLILSF